MKLLFVLVIFDIKSMICDAYNIYHMRTMNLTRDKYTVLCTVVTMVSLQDAV